jgi:hypothetical protein
VVPDPVTSPVNVIVGLTGVGKVTVFKFKAVTCPVVELVTLSTTVNVPPKDGDTDEVVSDLVIPSWFTNNVPKDITVDISLPPAIVTVVPEVTGFILPLSAFNIQLYIPDIGDQVLSPLK